MWYLQNKPGPSGPGRERSGQRTQPRQPQPYYNLVRQLAIVVPGFSSICQFRPVTTWMSGKFQFIIVAAFPDQAITSWQLQQRACCRLS
jgi:hypothetical protein